MEILFDETYASEDGKKASRNIWYGYADMSVDGEYGKELNLNENLMEDLCRKIRNNLSESTTPTPTETNWYFYGNSTTQDAVGDSIRPTIMVRERAGLFVINFNMSDHNFAINLDDILVFKTNFEKRLASN
ncbi:hypothetical protein ASG89_00335 [Paenibacillus sp. Soil766]|uniref:hypothetical protein n=1 Tax=Paenibacillus sp. Soil766 TaxID=1736404 RepID=UPI00070E177A|nr:hypothetical protein [Paenibacillus sp. Soil766]KRF10035.1 hypothetical protein ASG89_00335 [Paenibacillus sp. Soil766]